MPTINQLLKNPRMLKIKKYKLLGKYFTPQKKAICLKTFVLKPKKPNSAQRSCVRVQILENKKRLNAYIPGEGGHNLQQYSIVLLRGGRTQDLPGVNYKVIRGVLDLNGIKYRITSRSKYGSKKWRMVLKKRNRFL
jgi:small subunit ribosomal protein S12